MTKIFKVILCASCIFGFVGSVEAKPIKPVPKAKPIGKTKPIAKAKPKAAVPKLEKINCVFAGNEIVGTASGGGPITKANPELNDDLAFDYQAGNYCFESTCDSNKMSSFIKHDDGELLLEVPTKPSEPDSWGDFRSTRMTYNTKTNLLETQIIYFPKDGYYETGKSIIKMNCKVKK